MIKGYSKLRDIEKAFISQVHNKHYKSMGISTRSDYEFNEIEKIKRNNKDRCFEVYFKNGEWFKYFSDGSWG